MRLTSKLDFSSVSSAQDIFEAILTARDLELTPPKPSLTDLISSLGLSLRELAKTKKLINRHIVAGNDILIYGDYDADGMTATAILYLTLSHLARGSKARIFPFIPDRVRHGYGLSDASLADIFSGHAFSASAYPDFSPRLVVTVDNGIVAHHEITVLKERGLDVILTDHHQPSDSLPPADIVLHSLVSSGAGLAWVLALYLADESPASYRLLELATIGIVADMLPLTGINRRIVYHGLELLTGSQLPGVRALIEESDLVGKSISAGDLNFRLAPRLNAAGRLADATEALRLLCTKNPTQAKKLAQLLSRHNADRQALTDHGIKHALSGKPSHQLIVAASSKYHEGVVGLIAGKLAERFHRPALAISVGKDFAKGSARSVGGIDIITLLRRFSPDFVSLGGHELAAGFTVKTVDLADLTKKLEDYADRYLDPSLLTPNLTVEGELVLSQTSLTLARLLTSLAPFGLGNPQPSFLSRGLSVLEDKPLGSEGQHRRLTLSQAGETRQAIWFNCPHEGKITTLTDLVYTLDINSWRDKNTLQLMVKHAEI